MTMLDYRRKLTAEDMERARIPARHWGARFVDVSDDVVVSPSGRRGEELSPRAFVRRYLEQLGEMWERGVGLILFGPNGTGKTSAAVVVAKEYRRRGFTVLFFEAADMKRTVVEREGFDEEQTLWERAREVDVLVLDDLGKGNTDSTGFGASLLDELVRTRCGSGLVTIITSNRAPRTWEDSLGVVASTVHALKECALPYQLAGRDHREEKSRELQRLMAGS